MKIGICTGGGDCPGLNAAIRAAVKYAIYQHKMECVGIMESFNGLLYDQPKVRPLTLECVSDILDWGGTILGTYNRGNVYLAADGQKQIEKTKAQYQKLGLDGLLVIGGEGTQGMAKTLVANGVKIVGIPKTIDNDLPCTDQTIGFQTCVDFVAESIIRLRSTAESHNRIMVVEVMGRDSGYIALQGGIAGGASVVLIPEIPFDLNKIAEHIEHRKKSGYRYSLVVVSEGATAVGGKQMYDGQNTGVKNLGGVGAYVSEQLFKLTGDETRFTVLGHLQRGGSPSAFDRIFATRLGVQAIDHMVQNNWNQLVTVNQGLFGTIGYADFPTGRRKIDFHDPNFVAAKSIGIQFGQ